MSAIKAEDIYKRHIKPLPPGERLRILALIGRDLAEKDAAGKSQRSLMELHGLGKEIWEGVDAQEYVDEMRKEWDDA